jgi:hypothetical protein
MVWPGPKHRKSHLLDRQYFDLSSISSLPRSNNSRGEDHYTNNPVASSWLDSSFHKRGDVDAPPADLLEVCRKGMLPDGFDHYPNGLEREPPIRFDPPTPNDASATSDSSLPSFGNSLGSRNTESASTLAGYACFPNIGMEQSHFMPSVRCSAGLSAQPQSKTFANTSSHSLHNFAPPLGTIPTVGFLSHLNPSHDFACISLCFSHNEKIPLIYPPSSGVAEYCNPNNVLCAFNNDQNDFPTIPYNARAPNQPFPAAGCTVLPSGLGENLPLPLVDGSSSPMECDSGLDLCYLSGYLNTKNSKSRSGPTVLRPSSDLTHLAYVSNEQVSCGFIFKVPCC